MRFLVLRGASSLTLLSWESKGIPPKIINHHHPLIRPYFGGGGGFGGGVPLDFHDVVRGHVPTGILQERFFMQLQNSELQ